MSEPQEPREAWSEVGKRFTELGRMLGDHFSRPDASRQSPAAGEPAGTPEQRQAVLDAVRRVGEAAQQLGDQASEAVRDPELRQTAQRATRGLADALEVTFGQLVGQLRERTGASSGPAQDAWSRSADEPRAVVEPVPLDGGAADAGPGAGAAAGPGGGPDPDPAPGDDPDTGQSPERPPADS